MENTASILVLVSGLAHAVVNAILKAGNDKMSRRALIDGFSALILAPAAFLVFALIRSFEQADMTVAYPIARGLAPMLAAAGAVALFHEWALLTGTCIAAYTVIDAQGVRAAPTAMSHIVWTFILLGGGLGTFFALWRGKEFFITASPHCAKRPFSSAPRSL